MLYCIMKASTKSKRNTASVLLICATATMALIVFGIIIYNIVKVVRRIDGRPYHNGMFTNDESIVIPGDKWDTNMVCWWEDVDMWWQWDHTIPTGSLVPDPAPVLLSSVASETLSGPVLYTSRESNGVVLRIDWSTTQAPLSSNVTFRDLGMPVDENGMPADLSWSIGSVPSEAGEEWEVQRSTNMVNWEKVTTMTVRSSITNMHRDNRSPVLEKTYYRATAIQPSSYKK